MREKFKHKQLKLLMAALFLVLVLVLLKAVAREDVKNSAVTEALENSLIKMGYEAVEVSGCWLKFERNLEPSENNGWVEHYIRHENLDYFQGFYQDDIQKIEGEDYSFYGIETFLGSNHPLNYRTYDDFKNWVNKKYPGADWPDIKSVDHLKHIPDVENALQAYFTNLEKLSRNLIYTQFGKKTLINKWFQITWKDRAPLVEFKNAVIEYANEHGCDVEN